MSDKHVLIVGAGFSRSVSSAMPLTDELGRRALERLGIIGETQLSPALGPGQSFESWLSALAEDQPHLREADNRQNAAVFAAVRDAIAESLVESERDALLERPPAWLFEFVAAVHQSRSTVLTLNYDTLIEAAVGTHSLWSPEQLRRVLPDDVLWDLPPLPGMSSRTAPAPTFALIKLHGSLDWWAVPNDATGATLNREPTRRRFGLFQEMTEDERSRELPGRERFIVPPLSTKSGYYRNPLVRELWQRGFAALRNANRVSVVGFSLPAEDTVIANLLRSVLQDHDVVVDVVNLSPEGVRSRLVGLGATPEQIHMVGGAHCVQRFSDSLCGEASNALAAGLSKGINPDLQPASLAVAWGDSNVVGRTMRRVVWLRVIDHAVLELILEDESPPHGATSVRRSDTGGLTDTPFPTGADLQSVVRNCSAVVARDSRGTHTLIDVRHEGRSVGANRHWLIFVPASRDPS